MGTRKEAAKANSSRTAQSEDETLDGQMLIAEASTEAAAVADVVRRHIRPRLLEVKDPDDGTTTTLLAMPEGLRVEDVSTMLDERRTQPRRRLGTAKLGDLASFIAHAKRFADGDSVLFADPTPSSPSLTCVIDYHHAGPDDADINKARHGTHRSSYAYPLSDEWKAWHAANGKGMKQGDFAAFIEGRIVDVADPAIADARAQKLITAIKAELATPSRLLDLSSGLSVHVGAQVKSAVNLASGEVQVQYVTEHNGPSGAPLKVPSAFLIAIPVFRGGAAYQIPVRLRYRLQGAEIAWFFEMYRPELVFDHAFREACETAQKETGLPLFLGSPEA